MNRTCFGLSGAPGVGALALPVKGISPEERLDHIEITSNAALHLEKGTISLPKLWLQLPTVQEVIYPLVTG